MKGKATLAEKRKYLLEDKKSLLILSKVKYLESLNLSVQDEKIISLIRTQLEKNWRKPLIDCLNKMAKRYKK